MQHPVTRSCPLLLAVLVAGFATAAHAASTGPWKLNELQKPPAHTWGSRTGLLQEVYYEGEPLAGKPTRVFAYLGRPEGSQGTAHPAMILVHGGGGRAFPAWAEHWARRGYVALAMDLNGHGPAGPLEDGGPDQSDKTKFREFERKDIADMWSYHAVAAVIRGHSLLRQLPEVDARRVGITGISWGGYLTCIVAGLDSRFKVAVPVYGCGFLGENSYWKDKSLAEMSSDARKLWLQNFDPGRYLGQVRFPILFLNGTGDFAYPLDSYEKSYRLVPEEFRSVCIVKDLPHGHIWTFPEVDTFVDAALRGEVRPPRLGATSVRGQIATATVTTPLPVKEGSLFHTADDGPWQKRQWHSAPARIDGDQISAPLPAPRPRAIFFGVTDTRDLRASSELLQLSE